MNFPIFQVDAFTSQLFTGNPAAVVICESDISTSLMQAIAAENNLAETAFIISEEKQFKIRWFTPLVEVDLCGHATLAAAHVIFHHLAFPDRKVSFSSKSGPLYVRQKGEILFLDFPADSFFGVDPSGTFAKTLVEALSIEPQEMYKGRDDYLAIFKSQDDVLSLRPDMRLISKVPSRGVTYSIGQISV